MKQTSIEIKRTLDALVKHQETCLDRWISRCSEQGAREKYFKAKQDVLDYKRNLRSQGYAI
tara:strand:- start:1153 stop:1335 length:183 start_codon:yes stop_codon:yes gene_type:complete